MIGLAIILVLVVIVAPIVSFVWVWSLSNKVKELRLDLDRLRAGQVAQAPEHVAPAPYEEPAPAEVADIEERETPSPAVLVEEQTEPEAEEQSGIEIPAQANVTETPAPAAARVDRPDAVAKDATPPGPNWEERLTANWMVWLGGVTVALAAVFLFNYAIEQGYLTPLTRVVLGLIGGGLLLGAGEWTERRPVGADRFAKADYVPPALSAAGIFAILVSLFAAHALYGLIGPGVAFITMGMTAYASLVLALRQGWFVAALGIIAGYLIPALIDSPEPNAIALFVYLFVLTLGALALMVWRQWIWFSILTLVGSMAWPALWAVAAWSVADQGTVSLYVLGLAASFGALSTRLPVVPENTPTLRWIGSVVAQTSGLGFMLSGALFVLLAQAADFNAASFAFIAFYVALSIGLGVWRPSLESLPLISAAVVLITVVVWPQPFLVSDPERVQELGLAPVADAFGPFVMPPEFFAFSRALWAFAALFGIGCFVALTRVGAKTAWAGLSSFIPVLMFVAGYWRIADFQVDISWSYWAVGLAVILLSATIAANRRLAEDTRSVPVALYAAGVTAAVALIFTCLMREAWLTVALAAEVAALAWIWSITRVGELKTVTLAVLSVVVLRLIMNPAILEYQGSFIGTFSWVIYGYGLPAAATFYAARTFGRHDRDLVATLCEIAAAGFAFLMVSLQLKLWTSGAIYTPMWGLLDGAMQALWWIVSGALLLYRPFSKDRPWALIAGRIALGGAGLLVLSNSLMTNNPLFTPVVVGHWPLVNLLTVAYLLPALLLLGLHMGDDFDIPEKMRGLMSLGAGLLIFVDLTLEVRRFFWPNVMTLSPGTWPGDAEGYAYSAVWTVFALTLLALAIWRGSQALRYASLAVLLVTVAKLFLYDMSDLTGLYRVVSFLGLGLTLIGIGRVYQRYVFAKPSAEDAPEPEAET